MADEIARRDANGRSCNLIVDATLGTLKNWDGKVYVNTNKGVVSAVTVTANTSGVTAIKTPTAGKALRVYLIVLSAGAGNTANVDAGLKWGSGTEFNKVSLAPGINVPVNLGAADIYIQGAINEAINVNLSAAQTVIATIYSEEV